MNPRVRTIATATLARAKRCLAVVETLARFTLGAIGKGLRRIVAAVFAFSRILVLSIRLTAISFVRWLRTLLTAVATFSRHLGRKIVGGITVKRVRLVIALLLFVGWISYLGYAALTKSRSPIVSHAQVAATSVAIVAEVVISQEDKPSIHVKVIQSLTPSGPPPGTEVTVLNLPNTRGFDGPGEYLLLLQPEFSFMHDAHELPPYSVVSQQRSPGNDPSGVGKPAIYRWNDDVRKQAELLLREQTKR